MLRWVVEERFIGIPDMCLRSSPTGEEDTNLQLTTDHGAHLIAHTHRSQDPDRAQVSSNMAIELRHVSFQCLQGEDYVKSSAQSIEAGRRLLKKKLQSTRIKSHTIASALRRTKISCIKSWQSVTGQCRGGQWHRVIRGPARNIRPRPAVRFVLGLETPPAHTILMANDRTGGQRRSAETSGSRTLHS